MISPIFFPPTGRLLKPTANKRCLGTVLCHTVSPVVSSANANWINLIVQPKLCVLRWTHKLPSSGEWQIVASLYVFFLYETSLSHVRMQMALSASADMSASAGLDLLHPNLACQYQCQHLGVCLARVYHHQQRQHSHPVSIVLLKWTGALYKDGKVNAHHVLGSGCVE